MQMQFAAKPTTQQAESSNPLRQLREELDVMKAENKASADRIQELQNRDKTLSAELSKLQFTCAQQAKALDALKSLPEERDQYKKQADELSQRVDDLQAELAKVNPAALKRLTKATSAPSAASKPTTTSSPVPK